MMEGLNSLIFSIHIWRAGKCPPENFPSVNGDGMSTSLKLIHRVYAKKCLFFALFVCLLVLAGPASAIKEKPTPDQVRLNRILADFEKYAEKAQQDWRVPGMAIGIVAQGKLVFAKGFGVKEASKPDKVDERTVFQIGSTSKAFTAAVLAKMVDQKKLGWQDKVVDHLPWFAMYDSWVTRQFMVTDLMAQRSGLNDYAGDAQAFMGYDRRHIMRSLRYLKPISSFRSQYAYVNGPFVVAGALGEKLTHKTWEQNLKELFFNPLGMKNTSASLKDFNQAPNVTRLHVQDGDKVSALPRNWPAHNWPYEYGPAGGINSNVADMVKWLKFQMGDGTFAGKRILSKKNLEYMHLPQTVVPTNDFEQRNYYCLGWVYNSLKPNAMIWHTGGTTACKTMLAMVPTRKWGIVILSNLITNLPEALALRFYDMYFGNTPKDWSQKFLTAHKKAAQNQPALPKVSEPPLAMQKYAGVYRNPVYGDFLVESRKDALQVTMGPWKIKMRLKHLNRDAFLMLWPPIIDERNPETAEFSVGPDGRVESMKLSWDGGQKFVRLESKPDK